MPGEDIQSWSTTAATNGTADTLINWAEGQTRASVNNSARGMMAAHAKDRNLRNGSIVAGGTANALTFTSGVGYTSVPTWLIVRLVPLLTNGAAATMNMDGIGAVGIVNRDGTALVGGEIISLVLTDFVFNGTNWVLLSYTGLGITNGSEAPAGHIGEYKTQSGFAGISFGNNIWAQIADMLLPAGDWDVSGGANITGLQSTGVFYLSIGLVTAAPNTIPGYISTQPGFPDIWAITGPLRLNLAGTSHVYLNALNSTPAAGTLTNCLLQARRMR